MRLVTGFYCGMIVVVYYMITAVVLLRCIGLNDVFDLWVVVVGDLK